MNSGCGKVLGDFARSVLHHHRAVTGPQHAPPRWPPRRRWVNPRCPAVPPPGQDYQECWAAHPTAGVHHRCQVSGIASDASLGSSREHALPASQRAALRRPQPAGTPRGCGDLGLHGPPGSDATMMRLMPCAGCNIVASRHRDASGSSRLHRVHHRQAQRATPGRDRSCEGRAGLGHVTRLIWQPAGASGVGVLPV